MLKIFSQIFRKERRSGKGCSDELVKRATHRALDATDPRVRILSSCEKRMRPSVIHAIGYVIELVEALPEPVPMSCREWGARSVMGAMFSSGESLQHAIAGDTACKDFFASNRLVSEPVYALLLAKPSQKNTFGYDLVDDKPVSDVPLTVVSFDEHRLTGLATSEAETRRLLKLRAFDYLLTLALKKITDVRGRRRDLVARRKLLRTKLDILARSGGSLVVEPRDEEKWGLQQKMDQVETELDDMGVDETVLPRHLQIIIDTLATAEKQLWLERKVMHLDNMHYLRTAAYANATALPLNILHDANTRAMVVQPVVLAPESFSGLV